MKARLLKVWDWLLWRTPLYATRAETHSGFGKYSWSEWRKLRQQKRGEHIPQVKTIGDASARRSKAGRDDGGHGRA